MRETTLGDIADIVTGPFGSQLHMKDYVEQGIPVIMPQNIEERSFNSNNIAHITNKDFDRLIKYATQKNDIIYARRGDIEKHAFIKDDSPLLCGTGCLRVRANPKKVYPLFLSFYLNRPEVKHWLTAHSVGSNMPNLNTSILSSMPIELPNYDVQIKIANTLQLIDSRIENNNKISNILESLAKTIYDYWFLQYDFPNEEGKPYKSSGGKMVWNEELKREIPQNWKIGSFGDIIVENPKSTIQVNQITSAVTGFPFFTSGNAVLKANKSIIDGRNCYLNTGGNADLKFYIGEASYSTDTWCITGYNNMADFLYLTLSTIKKDFDVKFFQGTGLKHLQKPLLKKEKIYIPPHSLIDEFNKHIQPMFNMISENIRENQELTSLRDWLLPLLINGQVGFRA